MMKQAMAGDSDGTKDNEEIRHFEQDNRGQNASSSSDVHRSTSSFASGSPWSRWIFHRNSADSVTNSRRLSISDVVPNSDKLYSVLSNCSSPTESNGSGPPILDPPDDSPISVFHPSWIYENIPPPITPAPAVPDILEASLGCAITTTNSTPVLKTVCELAEQRFFQQRQRDCLPHCACRNEMAAASTSDSRSPVDDDLKNDSRLGFVDRARMVSFKRKKVAPVSSSLSEPSSDICAQCTCFLDPVNLSLDPPGSVTGSSAPYGDSNITHPCQEHRDYENTDVMKTVILHTGFTLPTSGQDLMLAMDSPRLKKANHLIKNDFSDDVPKVHLANGDSMSRRNKLNLTIDTGSNGANGYFYDPICEFLMSSPVMKKLKELGFQYPTFPADACNKDAKRVKILYVFIALLLLTVFALILLNVFVPKILGYQSSNQSSSSNISNWSNAAASTTSNPSISDYQHGEYATNISTGSTSALSNSTQAYLAKTKELAKKNNFSNNVLADQQTTAVAGTTTPTVAAATLEVSSPTFDTHPQSNIGLGKETTVPTASVNTAAAITSGSSTATVSAITSISVTVTGAATPNVAFPLPGHAHVFSSTNDANTTVTLTSTRGPQGRSNVTWAATISTTSISSLFPVSYPADFKCPEDQFKCRSGISRMPCLYQWERCDGISDCSDGSDEELCDSIKCFGNFQCGDKSCVALAKVCNGIFDCPDGSDEQQCDKFRCQSYEYRCPSGYCIPKEWVCDGEADCPGHFDEYNCSASCSATHFRCPEGWCIPSSWRCNGIRDCAGGVDEENCACPKTDQLKCAGGGGKCVDKERICDGIPDCPDSSDEWNCVLLQGDSLVIRDQTSDELLPVCSQEWLAQDSDLVCRQLGYEKADRFWEVPLRNDNFTDLFVRSALTQPSTFNAIDRVQFLVKKKAATSCSTKKTIAISCQKFECGHWTGDPTDLKENRVRRMVGGKASKEHEWPSVAVLYHPQKKWACTASIIGPFWLITSALCVRRTDASPIDWKVIAGNSDPSETDPDRQVSRSILRFVQHPSYKLILTLLADFDVMLVQLSSPLPFASSSTFFGVAIGPNAPFVSPICLPEKSTPPGTKCVTAGWGYTNPGGYYINKQLKHLAVGIWPKEVCNSTAHYPALLSERSICASNDREDWGPCFNDEGAPLMCQYPGSPDRWYLAGVLTAQSCGSAVKHPAVYADVYSMRNWINGVVGRPVIT